MAYPGTPGYRPASPAPPKTSGTFGIGGPAGGGRAQPKMGTPKTRTDPRTGRPVMMSDQEIRAEANAQAWKSIQQMQGAIPSEENARLSFSGQRSAINDLTTAHRDWLERAGQYHVNMTNALSGAATAAAGAGDATAAGGAAAAGAPLGASFAGNVAPSAVAASGTDAGTTFQKIIAGELTSGYPQAIGANALTRVNQNENTTLADIRNQRATVANGLPDLAQKNYVSGYQVAIDKYKGELAAIALGQKGKTADAKLAETVRYHNGMLGLSEDRNAISRSNAETAYQRMVNSAAATDTKAGQRTAGDASNIKAALAAADLIYHPKPGKAGPQAYTRYGTVLKIDKTTDPITHEVFPAQYHTVSASTLAEAQAQLKAFMAANPKAGWTQPKLIAGLDKQSTTGGTAAPENARRQHAWHELIAKNSLLLHPYSEAELKTAFRTMVGAPKGAK